jgi:hypothetical protein
MDLKSWFIRNYFTFASISYLHNNQLSYIILNFYLYLTMEIPFIPILVLQIDSHELKSPSKNQ